MKDKNLISVIVPIYNVEKYLTKCLDSIISQTYKNLEIILVDDGSLDNCPKICDEYAKKDKRIMVIHKENGGLSDARNAGLEIAKGKYIQFIDSDDSINKFMIEKLYNVIIKNNSEIALCKINIVYDDKKLLLDEINLDKLSCDNIVNLFIKNNCEHKKDSIITDGITWSSCRGLYRRDIIGDIRFIKDMISEDFFFNIDVIRKCKRISVINEGLYDYYQRSNSIVRTYNEKKLQKRILFSEKALEKVKDFVNDNEYKNFGFYLYENCLLECIYASNYKSMFKLIKTNSFLSKLNNFKNLKARMNMINSKKKRLSCILIYLKWFNLYRKLYLKYKKASN